MEAYYNFYILYLESKWTVNGVFAKGPKGYKLDHHNPTNHLDTYSLRVDPPPPPPPNEDFTSGFYNKIFASKGDLRVG